VRVHGVPVIHAEERSISDACGCRFDVPTGHKMHACPDHRMVRMDALRGLLHYACPGCRADYFGLEPAPHGAGYRSAAAHREAAALIRGLR
jgi:hypothetical protein